MAAEQVRREKPHEAPDGSRRPICGSDRLQAGDHPSEDTWRCVAEKARDVVLFLDPPGTLFRARLSILPFPLAGEQTLLVTLADSTELTESGHGEKQLDTYLAQIAQLEQFASLGTCSAMLSHELNEPLTVVRLALEYSLESLQSASCPEAVTQQLAAALRAVSKMASIAKRLRRFARQGAPQETALVDLGAVAGHTAHLFQDLARQARTTLKLRGFDTLAPVHLKGDIEQLFFLLTENAIQAADGKCRHHVTISGAMRGEEIELRFCDDCGGIALEDRERLFEPFFTTKPLPLGTGLGLCVAQRIVSENGGEIRVESKPGEGATFIVSLPADPSMRDETERCRPI